MKAIYFEEPVDQFSCVERAWRNQLDGDGNNVIFLRSRPGEWTNQPEVWSIKYVLRGNCAFEVEGHCCEVFAGFCFVIPEHRNYRSMIRNGLALSVFGRPLAGAGPESGAGVFGVFELKDRERSALERCLAGLQDQNGSACIEPDQGREISLDELFPLPQSWQRIRREVAQWRAGSRAQRGAAQRLVLARHYLTSGFREHNICTRAADVANMTRSHFSRQFSALFGQSPRQYLVAYRGAVARSLLKSGNKTVEQVSAMLGYGHPSSLAHLFKRQSLSKPRNMLGGARRQN